MSDKSSTGYARPPQEHQFRKGRSGNPAGRPPGARNFKAVFEQALLSMARSPLDNKQKTLIECAVDSLAFQICYNPNPSSVAAAGKLLHLAMSLCPDDPAEDDGTGKNTGNCAPSPPETGHADE